MELKPFGAGNLRECLQSYAGERPAEEERHFSARENVHSFARVEIEHDTRWLVEVRDAMQERMDLEVRHGRAPRERRDVIDDDIVDVWATGAARHWERFHPSGVNVGASFS
jgi:hypothetical protein